MLTFHHQVVFDVIHREMCYLKPLHGHGRSSSPDDNSIATLSNYSLLPASTDIPTYMLFARECGDNKTALSYLGTIIDDKDLACGIADGMIDPISKVSEIIYYIFSLFLKMITTFLTAHHIGNYSIMTCCVITGIL